MTAFDKTCPECPMTFDDKWEYRCQRFERHGEIPDSAVVMAVSHNKPPAETPIDDWAIQVECWTEAA